MNVSISNPKGLNSPSGFSAKHGTKDREGPELARVTTPEALIPVTDELIRQAEQAGCGARFAGAGAGGSVWALGEKKRIQELKSIWSSTLAPIRGAGVLDCPVDPRGVR